MKNAVVLGVGGRFGRNAAQSLIDHGWQVAGIARSEASASCVPQVTPVIGDVCDVDFLTKACAGADVIVQAANPPYQDWTEKLAHLNAAAISAALANGSKIVMPQNVYVYPVAGGTWTESTPHTAQHNLARLRQDMEDLYKQASAEHGLRSIFLRMGDFIDGPKHRPSGNWFENHITAKVADGVFTYPGPMNRKHSWSYLPDAAKAMAALLDDDVQTNGHLEIVFPGWTLTGAELKQAIETALGRRMKRRSMPWMAMRIIALWSAPLKNVVSLKYLWDVEHRLVSNVFETAVPRFETSNPAEVFQGRWTYLKEWVS